MMNNPAQPSVKLSYDSVADVLYLSLGQPERAARSDEDELGIIWRFSSDGNARGATVQAFHQLWDGKVAELTELLASRLKLSPTSLQKELLDA